MLLNRYPAKIRLFSSVCKEWGPEVKNCQSSHKGRYAKHKSNLIRFAMTLIASTLFFKWRKKTGGRVRDPPLFTHLFTKVSFEIAINFNFSVFSWEGEYSCDTANLSTCLFGLTQLMNDSLSHSFYWRQRIFLNCPIFFFFFLVLKTFPVFLSFWLCLYIDSDGKDPDLVLMWVKCESIGKQTSVSGWRRARTACIILGSSSLLYSHFLRTEQESAGSDLGAGLTGSA